MKYKIIAVLGVGLVTSAFYLSYSSDRQKLPVERKPYEEREETLTTAPATIETEPMETIETLVEEGDNPKIEETWSSIASMATEDLKEELLSHEEEIARDDVIKRLNLEGEVGSKEREFYGRKFKRMSDLRVALTNRELEEIKSDLAAHKLKLQK